MATIHDCLSILITTLHWLVTQLHSVAKATDDLRVSFRLFVHFRFPNAASTLFAQKEIAALRAVPEFGLVTFEGLLALITLTLLLMLCVIEPVSIVARQYSLLLAWRPDFVQSHYFGLLLLYLCF